MIKKKQVFFDLSEAQPNRYVKYHGGGQYSYYFLQKLLEELVRKKEHQKLSVFINPEKQFDKKILKLLQTHKIRILKITSRKNVIDILSLHNYKNSTVVLPIPYGLLQEISFPIAFRLIITIHGLRNIELPSDSIFYWYKYPHYFKMFVMWLKHFLFRGFLKSYYLLSTRKMFEKLPSKSIILTDSQYSYGVMRLYFNRHLLQKKITVKIAYPLFRKDPVSPRPGNILSQIKNKSYFLAVSAGRPEKNCLRVLDALSQNDFFVNNPHWLFVLTGVNSHLKSFIQIRHNKIFSKLILLDYVSDQDLHFLYKHSAFSVYASLNEGYGYPIIESFSHGVPIITSNLTSLPEVGGKNALYFDPRNEVEIYASVQKLANDPALRKKLGSRGIDYFRKFSKTNEKNWSLLCRELFFLS